MTVSQPPGPCGEHMGAINYMRWRADPFGFLRSLAGFYGDIVRFDLGRASYVLVNGAAEVRQLFLEHWESLRKPEFVKDSNRGYWGEGLTTLEGETWRGRRRLLRPSLSAGQLASRLFVVQDCTRDMLSRWQPGREIDLRRELRVLTARIAARHVLDAEIEPFAADSASDRSGVLPFEEAFGEDYESIPGGDHTAPLVMVRPRAPRRMDATLRIIHERIASGKERGDVLSELLRARFPDGRRLGCDEIVGELIQMLFAGHHTIPFSVVHFWRDLARYPNAAQEVYAEVDPLSNSNGLSVASLSSSRCMAILKESMRLHPPAPILYREVVQKFELAGYLLARGVSVWVCPQLLHHDPRNFPDPEQFDTERFAPVGPGRANMDTYLPFGIGPRTCIGNRLALHQMTTICLLIAQGFRLDPRTGHSPMFRVNKA